MIINLFLNLCRLIPYLILWWNTVAQYYHHYLFNDKLPLLTCCRPCEPVTGSCMIVCVCPPGTACTIIGCPEGVMSWPPLTCTIKGCPWTWEEKSESNEPCNFLLSRSDQGNTMQITHRVWRNNDENNHTRTHNSKCMRWGAMKSWCLGTIMTVRNDIIVQCNVAVLMAVCSHAGS